MLTKEQMLTMLKGDVVPALGCTEPVCVALAAADASKAVGGKVQKIEVKVNANIYKNGMSAGIPNFHTVGLHYAAAIGAVLGNPERKLELLQDVTSEVVLAVDELVKAGNVKVSIDETQTGLYVNCEVSTEKGTGNTVIRGAHTNIVLTKVNDKVVFEKQMQSASGDDSVVEELKNMTIAEIRALVDSASEEELAFMLDGVAMNEALSDYSLTHEIGIGAAKTFRENIGTKLIGNDLMSRIMMRVMSAAENRLDGCPYPTMSSAGAGTKGLVVILPISETAKTVGASKEQTVKALAFGHLLNRYINAYVGKLAAVCSCCMASSTAACAAMTWLLGGNDEQIGFAIRNMTGTITGMICDGAKPSCALKLTSGVSTAVLSAILAMENKCVTSVEGIIDDDVDRSISNLTRIGSQGMNETDKLVLDIMTNKQCN